MENNSYDYKKLRRISAHLRQLYLNGFLRSRNFDLFCIAHDIDEIWNEKIFTALNIISAKKQKYNRTNFPSEWTDDLFNKFIITTYFLKKENFAEIISGFLHDYSKWSENFYPEKQPTSLENDFIRVIGLDLLDLGYEEGDLNINFSHAGFDLPEIMLKNKIKRTASMFPIEIQDSLKNFERDHPDPTKVAFIMMQFGKTEDHTNILIAIRKALAENKLAGVRADDKYYHDDNYYNILTYLHGCDFGIAVFETITKPQFNPNISLEVGYLLGLHKPVCLLKEKSLSALHSDLVGKLYREFDINNCEGTINRELNNWLFDKELFSNFV
jgi:hypothetical protein